VSLAIHPDDPDRVLAAGQQGLYSSSDAARRWRSVRGEPGLLAWTANGSAYAATRDGRVSRSRDGGASWQPVASAGGPPAAFESAGDDLYVALHDGQIRRSKDGGRTWTLRSSP
jgi:hypothetical protein